jgi:glycosyltransferase involved in cell wall biosynthesis
VVHATDPQRPWVPRGVAGLVTVYDLIPLREVAILRSWRVDHRYAYGRYIAQIKRADRIVAISGTTAEDLQERLGIEAERIDIVPPVVAVPQRIDRLEPSEPTFLWVGGLDAHKQPELAVRALARFTQLHGAGRLRLIGPGDDLPRRRIIELAAKLGVSAEVQHEGHLSDADLEAAYASATALLSTSRIEGFGLPGVEAALRGLPVIAVNSPAAMETLGGVAMLVPPDPDAIAQAMASVGTPSIAGLAAIRERTSLVAVARSLADVYRRMGVGTGVAPTSR